MDDTTLLEHHLEPDPYPANRDLLAQWNFVVPQLKDRAVYRGKCVTSCHSGHQPSDIQRRKCGGQHPGSNLCSAANLVLGCSAIWGRGTERIAAGCSTDFHLECDSRPRAVRNLLDGSGHFDTPHFISAGPDDGIRIPTDVDGSPNRRATLQRRNITGYAQQARSEEHTSELQSPDHLVCRLLLEKKKPHNNTTPACACKRSS